MPMGSVVLMACTAPMGCAGVWATSNAWSGDRGSWAACAWGSRRMALSVCDGVVC